jgi:hypothetical protein
VEPVWVGSLGGPLILVPESACPLWGGAPPAYPAGEGDYGRACRVDGYLGVIDVGATTALVLADHPATTAFLPELNVFVRAIALDDDVNVETLVAELLPTAAWDEALTWRVTEPVVLFDSVYGGLDLANEEYLRIALQPGEYTVEAAYVERPDAYLILVRLVRAPK